MATHIVRTIQEALAILAEHEDDEDIVTDVDGQVLYPDYEGGVIYADDVGGGYLVNEAEDVSWEADPL